MPHSHNLQKIYSNNSDLPSKTSGAIHAALPLLLVMYVFRSHAVPKSQIFNTRPESSSKRFGGFRSLQK